MVTDRQHSSTRELRSPKLVSFRRQCGCSLQRRAPRRWGEGGGHSGQLIIEQVVEKVPSAGPTDDYPVLTETNYNTTVN
jgi:hypothetical protein